MCAVAASVGTCWALYVPNTPSVGACWAFTYFQYPLQAISSAAPWTKPIPLKLQITKNSAQARAAALKLASARGLQSRGHPAGHEPPLPQPEGISAALAVPPDRTCCFFFSRASRCACAAAILPMALSVPVCARGRRLEARTSTCRNAMVVVVVVVVACVNAEVRV